MRSPYFADAPLRQTLDGGALDGAAGDWVRMSVVAELCRCTEFQLRLRLIARAVTTRWRSKPYARRYVDGCWYMRRGDIRRALRTKAPLRKQLSRATRHAVLQVRPSTIVCRRYSNNPYSATRGNVGCVGAT
jgi:hypothetical protein